METLQALTKVGLRITKPWTPTFSSNVGLHVDLSIVQ